MLAQGQLPKLQDLESALDDIVSEHYSIVVRNGNHILAHVRTIAYSSCKASSI